MQKKYFWFCCLIVICCRILASFVLPTFDDAFITYRYAQNLVAGHGLVYNTGEKIMGTTAPLFAVLSALPLMLSLSVPKWFVCFNLLCDLGTLYMIARFFFRDNKILLAIFTTLFALDPVGNRIAVGGMEANLFLFLSLLGLVLYLRERKAAAFALLSACYFLRPEAVILVVIVGCYDWMATRRLPWKFALLSGAVVAVPLAFIYAYYGQWLPQSVVAKSAVGRNSIGNLVHGIITPNPFNYFLVPLAVFGFFRCAFNQRILLLAGGWITAFAGAYFLRGPWIWTWYIYSIEVIQVVFAALGIAEIAQLLHLNPERFKWMPAIPLAAAAVWIVVGVRVGRSGVEEHVYGELQKDFETAGRNAPTVFLADDIGALGFYSHGYIYDNQMLVTPAAATFRTTRERILAVRPDYLFVYTDTVYLGLLRKDPQLSRFYVFVKRYSVDGAGEPPAGYGIDQPIVYKQDYLLYRKMN